MASTNLYAHAPTYVFPHTDTCSGLAWDLPSHCSMASELQKLREMNERLPKDRDEVTPVQAWFLLIERYDVEFLVGSVESVKRELALLVECFAFGSVMAKNAFWETVERTVITGTLGTGLI
jgi:hypothetical protein